MRFLYSYHLLFSFPRAWGEEGRGWREGVGSLKVEYPTFPWQSVKSTQEMHSLLESRATVCHQMFSGKGANLCKQGRRGGGKAGKAWYRRLQGKEKHPKEWGQYSTDSLFWHLPQMSLRKNASNFLSQSCNTVENCCNPLLRFYNTCKHFVFTTLSLSYQTFQKAHEKGNNEIISFLVSFWNPYSFFMIHINHEVFFFKRIPTCLYAWTLKKNLFLHQNKPIFEFHFSTKSFKSSC